MAIYVSKDIDAKLETEYQFQMVGCENLFLSLKMGNKKFIVGVVYKHPDANKILFLEYLEHGRPTRDLRATCGPPKVSTLDG